MPNTTTDAERRPATGRGRRTRWWLVALVLLVIVLAAAFTAYQALQARAAMREAAASLGEVRDAVAANDVGRAERALAEAQESTADARGGTHGPVWWVSSKLPIVGDDVSAVRTVTEVGDDLTHLVLPRLVDASKSMSPADLQPRNGRINIDAIEQAAPDVVAANRVLGSRVDRVAAIDTAGLVAAVAGPLGDMRETLLNFGRITDAAAKAVQLLPPMLGADGEREYLVLFQNNAEARATGGIPGAFAVVRADDGRIELGRQGNAGDLGRFDRPVVPLTRDELALYDTELATFAQNVNLTPDFPRSAQIARAMWRRSSGTTVDGVISTDPVGLSYLLEGTGPVDVAGQRLTPDNAVQTLLHDAYLDIAAPAQQNAFFALAARQVFDAVTSGQGDPRTLIEGMSTAAQDDRLLVWSAHQDEEALLDGTALSGELPDHSTDEPNIGVFFNDGTGAKMDYYLDYDVDVESLSCDAGGVQRLRVGVTMRSDAPRKGAGLPEYVLGPDPVVAPGVIRTNLMIFAPWGGQIGKATFDGDPFQFFRLQQDGRPVAVTTVDTGPGEEQHFTLEVTSGPGQSGDTDLRVTPGAQPDEDDANVGASACS